MNNPKVTSKLNSIFLSGLDVSVLECSCKWSVYVVNEIQ